MKNIYQDSIYEQKCYEESMEDSTINFFKDRNINKNMLKEFIKSDKISNLNRIESSSTNKEIISKHIENENVQPDFELENSMINYNKRPQENIEDSLFQINPKHIPESKPQVPKENFYQNNDSISNKHRTFSISQNNPNLNEHSISHSSASENFDVRVVYKYNEKLKYPYKYGLWYIHHPRANSSFGPLSSDEVVDYFKKGKINIDSKIRLIDIFNFIDASPFSFISISELEDHIDSIIPNLLLRFIQNLKIDNGLKSYINFENNEADKKREIVLQNEIFEEKERSWDEKYIPVKEIDNKPFKNKNKKKKGKPIKVIEHEKNEITLIKNNEYSAFVSESVLNIINKNPPVKEVRTENILESIDEEEWKEVGKKKTKKEEKNKLVGIKDTKQKKNDEVNMIINSNNQIKVIKSDLHDLLKKKAEARNNQANEFRNNFNKMEDPIQKKGTKPKLVEMNVNLNPAFSILGENIYRVESKKQKK